MRFALKIKMQICRITALFSAAVMIVTLLVSGMENYQKTASAEFTDIQQYYIDQVTALVNIERASQGLAPLSVYPLLCEAATQRSVETIELFDHQRPDGTMCYTILDEYSIGYRAFGENIAMGYATPEDVVEAWMNSSGHRANILSSDFTHIGIGYYKSGYYAYWTQLFLTPNSTVSDAYIPEYRDSSVTTTTTKAATTTTTTGATTTTTTTPKVTTTTTSKPTVTTTTTPGASTTTTTTTTTTPVTTTTLYAPPTVSINVVLENIDDMYFADDTESLFDGCAFEIVVKKPISQFVYSNFYFDLSSIVSLDGVDASIDSAAGISPCDIYYSASRSGKYSLSFIITQMTPTELADLISQTVQIDLDIIKDAMKGKIVDDNFEYLDSVFGTYNTAIALRGDVDLNGLCDSNDAKIVADYEAAYADARAKSILYGTDFVAPALYENSGDSPTVSTLREFAANVNCDTDDSGNMRIDTLDASYIQMFATQYKTICDELETNSQQLDIVKTTISIWENLGIA